MPDEVVNRTKDCHVIQGTDFGHVALLHASRDRAGFECQSLGWIHQPSEPLENHHTSQSSSWHFRHLHSFGGQKWGPRAQHSSIVSQAAERSRCQCEIQVSFGSLGVRNTLCLQAFWMSNTRLMIFITTLFICFQESLSQPLASTSVSKMTQSTIWFHWSMTSWVRCEWTLLRWVQKHNQNLQGELVAQSWMGHV